MTDTNDDLLKKYLSIENELAIMKKNFKQTKKEVQKKLLNAHSDKQKNKIMLSFDEILNQIITNNKKKYLMLIDEKNAIKHKLYEGSKKIDDTIDSLLDKYKKTHIC